jgi:hypothetical protein
MRFVAEQLYRVLAEQDHSAGEMRMRVLSEIGAASTAERGVEGKPVQLMLTGAERDR